MKEQSIMKTPFKFIISVLAASALLASCRKELSTENNAGPVDGVRVISVSFDNSTKAHFDGLAPKFDDGDLIMVSNETESEVCTLTVAGNNATFTTNFTGDLTAIYPADAAVLGTEGTNPPIVSPYFKVLASQNGKAIIAKATIGAEETGATFEGQAAVFEITPPAGATSITIKSLKPIGTDGRRSGTAVAINDDTNDDAKCVITVTNTSLTTFYVSLKAGVNLSDLSFDAGPTYGMKGIPTSAVTAAGKDNQTAPNTKYTIDNANNSWHPYVEIEMTVNDVSKIYKWAKMNVGATEETGLNSYGKYFSWGEVSGHTPDSYTSSGSFTSDFASFDHSDERYPDTWNAAPCFDDCNTPYYDGDSYYNSKYNSPGQTLELADDAAYANWGGSWRMPTKAEFNALCDGTKSWDSTNKGYQFGISPNQIFLPAAGYGYDPDLCGVNSGNYWSSSLSDKYDDDDYEGPYDAYFLYFCFEYSMLPYMKPVDRYYGNSVRALSE